MKRMSEWVARMLSPRATASGVVDQPSDPLSVEDLVMPDIYADEQVATVPHLKVIDLSSPDIDDGGGFDPYDSTKK